MRLILTVVLGLAAWPVAAQTVVDGSDKVLPSGGMEKFAPLFRSALKDPASAQISELAPAADGVFCGKVNAKNSMGGYAGPRPFAINFSTSEVFVYPTIIAGKALTEAEYNAKKQALEMLLKYCVKE